MVHLPSLRSMTVLAKGSLFLASVGLVIGACSGDQPRDPQQGAEESERITTSVAPVDIEDDEARTLALGQLATAMSEDIGISRDVAACILGTLAEIEEVRRALAVALVGATSGGDPPNPFDQPSEEMARAYAGASLDCGVLTDDVSEISGGLGVSEASAACLLNEIIESGEFRSIIEASIVADLMGLPAPAPTATERAVVSADFVTASSQCGIQAELGGGVLAVELASDLGVSEASGVCVMRSLLQVDAYMALMGDGLVAGLIGDESVDPVDRYSEEINEATIAAILKCLSHDELVILGMVVPSVIPDTVAGFAWIPSEVMAEIGSVVGGYGGHSWIFAIYGDDMIRYRVVVAREVGAADSSTDMEDLRSKIPAEGLFAIEGGFDMKFDEVLDETRGDVHLTCAPGFVGDETEVRWARSNYDQDEWNDAVDFGLVRAMCFFEGTVIGFIVSDNHDDLAELMDIATVFTEAIEPLQ